MSEIIYGLVGILASLWPVWLIGGIVYLVVRRKKKHKIAKPQLFKDSLFSQPLSGTTSLISIILVLTLLAISERILYDLARSVTDEVISYLDNLQIIALHSLFIIPVLVVAIIAMIALGQKREKYAVVLIPYFATAIILTLQLLCQITVYFYNHHTKLQYYIIMPLIIGIVTVAIYYIQRLYQRRLEEMRVSS